MRRLISLGCALLLGLLLVLLNIGVSAAQDATPGIIITEVLAANARTVTDDRGRYVDWIELHNPTDTPTSLAGYTLTDDPDEPAKWRLPVTTLAPGAFLVVWASGANRVEPEGWHTNFRLSRGGEYAGLFGPGGQLVDAVTFGEQEVDVSLGRLGTVSSAWVAFSTATPWRGEYAPSASGAGRAASDSHARQWALRRPSDWCSSDSAGTGQHCCTTRWMGPIQR